MIIILALFTLLSMKRGAILVLALGLVPFILGSLKASKGKKRLLLILMIIISIGVLYKEVDNLMSSNVYFQYRLEQTLEGQTSNRDIIYERLWKAYTEEYSVIDMAIGRGADASIEISGMQAHNDWLEALIDQGLLGALFLACFWITFFIMYRKSITGNVCSLALLVLFLIGFIKTFFSMSIGQMPFYYSAVLGYCCANYNKSSLQPY